MGQHLLEKKPATMIQLHEELIKVWFHDILYDVN